MNICALPVCSFALVLFLVQCLNLQFSILGCVKLKYQLLYKKRCSVNPIRTRGRLHKLSLYVL